MYYWKSIEPKGSIDYTYMNPYAVTAYMESASSFIYDTWTRDIALVII